MNNIGVKKKCASLEMDITTIVKLNNLTKQCCIKGYYKLKKAELIHKLEAHPYVNEERLIPGLEIPRNKTWSVNTSAILDEPILEDKTAVLQPTPNSLLKA